MPGCAHPSSVSCETAEKIIKKFQTRKESTAPIIEETDFLEKPTNKKLQCSWIDFNPYINEIQDFIDE